MIMTWCLGKRYTGAGDRGVSMTQSPHVIKKRPVPGIFRVDHLLQPYTTKPQIERSVNIKYSSIDTHLFIISVVILDG